MSTWSPWKSQTQEIRCKEALSHQPRQWFLTRWNPGYRPGNCFLRVQAWDLRGPAAWEGQKATICKTNEAFPRYGKGREPHCLRAQVKTHGCWGEGFMRGETVTHPVPDQEFPSAEGKVGTLRRPNPKTEKQSTWLRMKWSRTELVPLLSVPSQLASRVPRAPQLVAGQESEVTSPWGSSC